MSQIDYSRLHSLTIRQITNALQRDGFSLVRQRGSHQQYRHTDGRQVTVPYTRPGGTFAPGTLRSIIELQAGWTDEDLRRLRLL